VRRASLSDIVDTVGWRKPTRLLGLLPLIIALPLAYLSLRDINDDLRVDATTQSTNYCARRFLGWHALAILLSLAICLPKYQELGLTLPCNCFRIMVIILIPHTMMAFTNRDRTSSRDKFSGTDHPAGQ